MTTTCANCGKDEGEIGHLKTCNACKLVKYRSRDCQAAHRPQHKKACKQRAAELHEKALFKEVEPEECPICLLPMPKVDETLTKSCCGKRICHGCIYTMVEREGNKFICAFCRTPPPTSREEEMNRIKKLADNNSAEAFYMLAYSYDVGMMGMQQNHQKANELYLKAGELGFAKGYYSLGMAYDFGEGVEVDKKKAKYYYELAAMKGCMNARHNLGCIEGKGGNHQRAIKHYLVSAKGGYDRSLDNVKVGFRNGDITKDVYANTLRAYHERQKEIKSDERDKAAHLKRMGVTIYDT